MSAQRFITIKCDVIACGEKLVTPAGEAREARSYAAQQGWQVRREDNAGRDVCPKHDTRKKVQVP